MALIVGMLVVIGCTFGGYVAMGGKLGVLYHSALRWSIAPPLHIWGAALYLLCHTIPLHGLITK